MKTIYLRLKMTDRQNITITDGGMYQEWMCLIDLVTPSTAKKLNELASEKGCRIVEREEAIYMGYEELVNWSKPETDILVLIAEEYLVCLNKNMLYHDL